MNIEMEGSEIAALSVILEVVASNQELENYREKAIGLLAILDTQVQQERRKETVYKNEEHPNGEVIQAFVEMREGFVHE